MIKFKVGDPIRTTGEAFKILNLRHAGKIVDIKKQNGLPFYVLDDGSMVSKEWICFNSPEQACQMVNFIAPSFYVFDEVEPTQDCLKYCSMKPFKEKIVWLFNDFEHDKRIAVLDNGKTMSIDWLKNT